MKRQYQKSYEHLGSIELGVTLDGGGQRRERISVFGFPQLIVENLEPIWCYDGILLRVKDAISVKSYWNIDRNRLSLYPEHANHQ